MIDFYSPSVAFSVVLSGFDFADIEVIKDCIYSAERMILWDEITNAGRKKKGIVLSVRFI